MYDIQGRSQQNCKEGITWQDTEGWTPKFLLALKYF